MLVTVAIGMRNRGSAMLSQSAKVKLEEIVKLNMKAVFGDAEVFAAQLELTKSMDGKPIEVPTFVEERVGLIEWAASDGSTCFTMFPCEGASEGAALRPREADAGAGAGACEPSAVAAGAAPDEAAAFSISQHVLFWHGGGLVMEIGLPHWEFSVALVESLGCAVTMPAYPLLPLHDWRRTHACLEAVYCDLLAKVGEESGELAGCDQGGSDSPANPDGPVGFASPANRIVLAGDSAGGLLAISLAQLCVMNGWAKPRAVITFSPMTDLSDEVDLDQKLALEAVDPMIGLVGLGQVPALWVPDEADREEFPPCVLSGPMADLPSQWLFAGSREALLPEMLEYARRVEEAGSPIVVNVREGLWHDYPLMLDIDEGREAFEQVLEIVRTN